MEAENSNPPSVDGSKVSRLRLYTGFAIAGIAALFWIWCQLFGTFYIARYDGYYSVPRERKIEGTYLPLHHFDIDGETIKLIPSVLEFSTTTATGTLRVPGTSYWLTNPGHIAFFEIEYLGLMTESGDEVVLLDSSTAMPKRRILNNTNKHPKHSESEFVRNPKFQIDPELWGKDLTVTMRGITVLMDGTRQPFSISKPWYYRKGTRRGFRSKPWGV